MKKELAAGGLLLLLILGAWLNIRHIDALTESVTAALRLSERASAEGDAAGALNALREARARWERERGYAGVFLNHRDLDAVYDGFSQLEELLLQGEFQAAPAAYRRLLTCLEALRDLEHARLETVLTVTSPSAAWSALP